MGEAANGGEADGRAALCVEAHCGSGLGAARETVLCGEGAGRRGPSGGGAGAGAAGLPQRLLFRGGGAGEGAVAGGSGAMAALGRRGAARAYRGWTTARARGCREPGAAAGGGGGGAGAGPGAGAGERAAA